MKIGNESKALRGLRFLAGALLIAVGALAVAAGLAGPEPIRLGTGRQQYYQLVVDPAAHPLVIGTVGLLLGVLLVFLPALLGKKGR